MYAIIETGGKQHKVTLGAKIRVEKLNASIGSDVQIDKVLLVSDNDQTAVGTPYVENMPVCAKVVDHGRGKKIRVIKMKRRKNYRRTQGHRQDYTELQILSVGDAVLPVAENLSDVVDTDEEELIAENGD